MNLNYPVFVFQKGDNMIYVFFKEVDLKSTSTQIFKTFNYQNVIHIDSLGNKYKIKKAFKVKYLGLWGFNPLLKGRQILVDFEYESEVEQITLDDFKRDILFRIDKTKRIWQSAWDIEELKTTVENSKTFKGIAQLLK